MPERSVVLAGLPELAGDLELEFGYLVADLVEDRPVMPQGESRRPANSSARA